MVVQNRFVWRPDPESDIASSSECGMWNAAQLPRSVLSGILIVTWISQCISPANAADWLLCINQPDPPELLVETVTDWPLSQNAETGSWVRKNSEEQSQSPELSRIRLLGISSAETHQTILPLSQLSPEAVFGHTSHLAETDESLRWIVPAACSDTCTAIDAPIPWSRWDDETSAFQFAMHDFATLIRNLDNDFLSLWELENVAFVGAGLGLSLGLRGSADAGVREYVAQHPGRWGKFSDTLGVLGNTETQIAGMALLYGYAFQRRDDELMNFTRLMIRSYTLTGLSSLVVKGIANTDRPSDRWNNGHFGFPSAHVSTSFAIAATIEEYYGPQAGIPAYLVAGMIGWSRIDQRDHDLSDVIFGAVLGYAIAKSIAGQELRGDSRIRVLPWTDLGNRTLGAMWEVEF